MTAVPDHGDGSRTGTRTRAAWPSRLRMLEACALAMLTGSAGIVAALSGAHPQRAVAEAQNPPAAVADACEECGLIESIRVIEYSRQDELPNAVASTNRYETSIRLHDGSIVVIVDSTPRTWRFGGRVKIIGGAI
jgi:hypothetical protein